MIKDPLTNPCISTMFMDPLSIKNKTNKSNNNSLIKIAVFSLLFNVFLSIYLIFKLYIFNNPSDDTIINADYYLPFVALSIVGYFFTIISVSFYKKSLSIIKYIFIIILGYFTSLFFYFPFLLFLYLYEIYTCSREKKKYNEYYLYRIRSKKKKIDSRIMSLLFAIGLYIASAITFYILYKNNVPVLPYIGVGK